MSAAAAARAAGRDDQAREWLAEASAKARRLGARPLLATAEQALARARRRRIGRGGGRRPDTAAAADHPPRGRGPHESRDRAELYLSVRTVDMHVRHSLIALGCRSRIDAARKASGLGLLEQH